MLFVTNRTPKEKQQADNLPRKISFELQNTQVAQDVYYCRRNRKNSYEEIGKNAFFQELKDLDSDFKKQILFYIHGFNNTGEDQVFPNAKKLQQHLGDEIVVIALIWPCDDDSIVAILDDYWDDQDKADASGGSFYRMLGHFEKWRNDTPQQTTPCYRRINLLAHSMGNRVLRNVMAHWKKKTGEVPMIFRNIFMFAADVVNEALDYGQPGNAICDSARNIVVYYASDDLAMPASKVANTKNKVFSRRLGLKGPSSYSDNRLPLNVFAVDCDNFNNSMDWPAGHTYFLDNGKSGNKLKLSPALTHMKQALETGRVKPDKRKYVLKK